MANISCDRFLSLREQSGFTQAQMGEKLGITAKYVGMIERGDKAVDETSSLGILFRTHEAESGNAALAAFPVSGTRPTKIPENPKNGASRRIPVIGWAHAGQAASYDELPVDWQQMIPTDCRDPKAFAVMLEGDSMEPNFRDGDLLVLMPSERIHNGCTAVVRLASDGVLLRRLEVRGPRVRLVPLNPRYEVEEMECEQISWAYPVWGRWSQIWK